MSDIDCGDCDCGDEWLCCAMDTSCECEDSIPVDEPTTSEPFTPQPIITTMPILTSSPISTPIAPIPTPITTQPRYMPVPTMVPDIALVNATQPVASAPIHTTHRVATKPTNQKPKKPLYLDGSNPNDYDLDDLNANDLNPNDPPPTSNARK